PRGEILLGQRGDGVLDSLPSLGERLPDPTRALGQRALATPLAGDANQRRVPATDRPGLALADPTALDRQRAQGRAQAIFVGLFEQLEARRQLLACVFELGLGGEAIEAGLRAAVGVDQQGLGIAALLAELGVQPAK